MASKISFCSIQAPKSLLKQPLKHKVITFSGEESAVPNYVLIILRKLSELKVLYLKERRKQIGKDEAQQLLSLKVQRGGTEILRNIQGNVDDLLGVQIDAFQGTPAPGRNEPSAELDVDNFLIEVNGSGVREALRLILDVEFEHPSILMVEEPETHLHPALETSMMHYLKRISSGIQVFITTHSTNFLDTTEMRNVYLVSKTDSTQIQLLDYEEAESQIPKELGIRLSSLFMFDRLVFVEGPSDEGILREWASILRVNFSQSNVGFVAMGGVRNFTHYAAQTTLAFLTKRQIGIWFLMDRDERDDTEVTTLKDLFKDKATVKVLDKREIENYMICARAIREFIGLKKEAADDSKKTLPSEADITVAINECADELKQFTIDKRVVKALCKPVYPSVKSLFEEEATTPISDKIAEELQKMSQQLEASSNQLAAEYKSQTASVNAVWESNKLSLAPGDVLLDMVCQRYGVRFRKDRDGVRLAALMTENEIDGTVKSIIREIGS